VIDGTIYHYSLMSTLEEIPTPQMGLAPRIAVAGFLANRIPWIIDSEKMNDREIAAIRRDHPDERTESRVEARQCVDVICNSLWRNRNIVNQARDDIPLGIFLTAKGVFISCPRCYYKSGLVEPIRVGQCLCLDNDCWHEIRWAAHGDTEIHVDSLRVRANMYEDSFARGKRPKNMGKYSLESRYRRAFAQRTIKRRRKWDAKLMSKDMLGLTNGLAWSAAGGTWDFPRPHQVCPWDSDTTEFPGYQWEDLFPPTFPFRVRQFMKAPTSWTGDNCTRTSYHMDRKGALIAQTTTRETRGSIFRDTVRPTPTPWTWEPSKDKYHFTRS
jgi:hypothetical protein